MASIGIIEDDRSISVNWSSGHWKNQGIAATSFSLARKRSKESKKSSCSSCCWMWAYLIVTGSP